MFDVLKCQIKMQFKLSEKGIVPNLIELNSERINSTIFLTPINGISALTKLFSGIK